MRCTVYPAYHGLMRTLYQREYHAGTPYVLPSFVCDFCGVALPLDDSAGCASDRLPVAYVDYNPYAYFSGVLWGFRAVCALCAGEGSVVSHG